MLGKVTRQLKTHAYFILILLRIQPKLIVSSITYNGHIKDFNRFKSSPDNVDYFAEKNPRK